MADAMRDARSRFLQERGARTLRVACWPAPELDEPIDLEDGELRALLRDGGPIGVRSSGWNYLSTWTELGLEQGALTVGRSEPPVYRHVRIEETGRVELTTDEDELWSWHQASLAGQVVDPFVLTEYPAGVLRLASWLLKRAPRPPDRVLVELVIRNGADLHLFPGHPGSVTFGFGGIGSRFRGDGPDLCVAPTGPLEIDGEDFLENPDRAAPRLARAAYQAFGLGEADMPFFDARHGRFSFPG